MDAANLTTAPSTLTVGATFESLTWRVHRYADHLAITDLRNAGRRGSTAAKFYVSAFDSSNADAFEVLVGAAVGGAHSDAAVAEMSLLLGVSPTLIRSRDVDPPCQRVVIDTPKVHGFFNPWEFVLTFVWQATNPATGKTFSCNERLAGHYPSEALAALAWARANTSAIAAMSKSEVDEALKAIGVRTV